MTKLFRRAARIVVDTIELASDPDKPQSLDVRFSVERSLKPEPNTAEIQIWNLSPDHRSQLEELDRVSCTIEAGYADRMSLLYAGTIRTTFTERQGPDLVTTLHTGDGEKEYQQSRINLSIAKGTPNVSVLDQVVAKLGIDVGNLASAAGALAAEPLIFPAGGVLSGSASQILSRIAQSLGFEWSIQGGALQILRTNAGLAATATKLTPDTGLVGVPSVDTKGILTAQALLIPEIFPGRLVVLESARLSGNYRIQKCAYTGDTAGAEWYVSIEAKKL